MIRGRRTPTKFKRGRTKRTVQKLQTTNTYEPLEKRQVLSAYFPAFIGGQLTLGDPGSAAPYPLSQTFNLSSNPTATKTIYLDYDGHRSVNNSWGHDIRFPAFSRDGNSNQFSTAELIEIQQQFQNVAEDFLPFNVNVTTKNPGVEALRKSGLGDQRYGVRSINTQATDGFGDTFGGVGFLYSFSSSLDDPVFVFNKGVNAGGQTNSHEVGHALGLDHDGLGSNPYHPGTGSGTTRWGPLLGAPFTANVTQFSNGDYANSTNTEDDLAIITQTFNGFGYRADDVGNSIGNSAQLNSTNNLAFDWGIIERNSDRDFYKFLTGTGNVRLNVNAFGGNPNLDILARIHDSSGTVIATSNPIDDVDASFNLNLAAGEYYVSVQGTGRNGRYSDYGSLGFYTIEGNVQAAASSNAIGETGRVNNLTHQWKTVSFANRYENPVVVAGPASRVGGDRLTVRVRNVTTTTFQIRLDEYQYRDGPHGREVVDFMVIEAGEHHLSDGTIIRAGNINGQTHRWRSQGFGGAFSEANANPVLLTQLVSNNEPVAATTRVRGLSRDGFQLKIQEEQASNQAHSQERVGWIAVEQGRGQTGGRSFESFATPNSVRHTDYRLSLRTDFASRPAFIASMQTLHGGDPATIRYKNLNRNSATFFIEEERSADVEIRHRPEVVGYFAMPIGNIFSGDGQNRANASGGNFAPSESDGDGDLGRFGELVDGVLIEAMLQLESWGELALPLDHDSVSIVNHQIYDSSSSSNEDLGRHWQAFEDLVESSFKEQSELLLVTNRLEPANLLFRLEGFIEQLIEEPQTTDLFFSGEAEDVMDVGEQLLFE